MIMMESQVNMSGPKADGCRSVNLSSDEDD
jgi:hypothetical protein